MGLVCCSGPEAIAVVITVTADAALVAQCINGSAGAGAGADVCGGLGC